MAQHFLLSAKARTLSLASIYRAGEEKAYETFRNLRWQETNGEAVCPRCGGPKPTRFRRGASSSARPAITNSRVTSGTIFAVRKMAFVDLLAAICIIVNGAKGISALQLAAIWIVSTRPRSSSLTSSAKRWPPRSIPAKCWTAMWRWMAPISAAISARRITKPTAIDRRLAKHQTGKRRVVVAFRERLGRTVPFVTKSRSRWRRIGEAAC